MNTNDLRRAADLLEWLEEQTGCSWVSVGRDEYESTDSSVEMTLARKRLTIGSTTTDEKVWGATIALAGKFSAARSKESAREAFKKAVEGFMEHLRQIRNDVEEVVTQLEGIE